MTKQQIIKIVISVLIAALTALGAAFGLSSCNVTRTITTKSEYWQKADTSVVIQTKTIETYDASRKSPRPTPPLKGGKPPSSLKGEGKGRPTYTKKPGILRYRASESGGYP